MISGTSRRLPRLMHLPLALTLLALLFTTALAQLSHPKPVPPPNAVAWFTDEAAKAGLTMTNVFGGIDTKKYIIETTGTGVAIFDYDNDGWPDIFVADGHIEDQIESVQKRVSYAEPPHLFRNLGNGKFEEVTAKVGSDFAAPKVARGAAYADINNDGALDLLVMTNAGPPHLYLNQGGSNQSLRIKLVGIKSNRDGIGATVRVSSGPEKQWLMMKSGSSYLSQSELTLTFGLGQKNKADLVEVTWPNGQIDKLSNIAARQTITIQEGKGQIASRPYTNK
jgi:hypothetical protein